VARTGRQHATSGTLRRASDAICGVEDRSLMVRSAGAHRRVRSATRCTPSTGVIAGTSSYEVTNPRPVSANEPAADRTDRSRRTPEVSQAVSQERPLRLAHILTVRWRQPGSPRRRRPGRGRPRGRRTRPPRSRSRRGRWRRRHTTRRRRRRTPRDRRCAGPCERRSARGPAPGGRPGSAECCRPDRRPPRTRRGACPRSAACCRGPPGAPPAAGRAPAPSRRRRGLRPAWPGPRDVRDRLETAMVPPPEASCGSDARRDGRRRRWAGGTKCRPEPVLRGRAQASAAGPATC
jgi:hypothetical protein